MIGISTFTFDINGCLVVHQIPKNIYEASRRGSITETLDGGVSAYDTGFTPTDQTLQMTITDPTRDMLVKLRYLVAYYGQLQVTCETGVYRAVLSFKLNNNELSLSLRIIRQLS